MIWSVVESESHIQRTLLKLIRNAICFLYELSHRRLLWSHHSLWSHLQTCEVIWSHWLIWSYLELTGPIGSLWSHLEPSGAVWSQLEPSGAIWSYRGAPATGVIWSHLKTFGATWSHLEPSGAVSSYLDPSESCQKGDVTICYHLV